MGILFGKVAPKSSEHIPLLERGALWDHVESWSDRGIQLLAWRRDVQSPPNRIVIGAQWAVHFDGRLDNRRELAAKLGLPADDLAALSDAELVYRAWTAVNQTAISWFKGDWVFSAVDRKNKTVYLGRDRLGARPLYYCCWRDSIVFASEIKYLLNHGGIPFVLDKAGLHSYLSGSGAMDDPSRTCFSGIQSVLPSHLVQISPDRRVASTRYWDFDVQNIHRGIDFQTAKEEFARLFTASVTSRSRANARTAVSVSGGLDSSSIFCEAVRSLRTAPLGVSYITGRERSDEQKYLMDIETQLAVKIHRIEIQTSWLKANDIAKQVPISESPIIDYLWGVCENLHGECRRLGAKTLLSGHWGDQIFYSYDYLIDLALRGRWKSVFKHLAEYDKWYEEELSHAAKQRLWRGIAGRLMPSPLFKLAKRFDGITRSQELAGLFSKSEAYPCAGRPFDFSHPRFYSSQSRALYMQARSTYNARCLEWHAKVGNAFGLDAAFPVFDEDVLQFMILLPGDVQNKDGVPRMILREAMRGVIPDSIRERKWKADFSDLVNDSVTLRADEIKRDLDEWLCLADLGWADASEIRNKMRRWFAESGSDDCTAAWNVFDVYAIELFARIFSNADSSRTGGFNGRGIEASETAL